MSCGKTVLAFDFGASSGRAVRAVFHGGELSCREVHRFENVPVEEGGTLYWDFDALLREVRAGIRKAGEFDSMGFDTWGVDFGLLDGNGDLLGRPVHYRDGRTAGMAERAGAVLPPETLYGHTGNQIMEINTLFQLLTVKEAQPELWKRADRLLFLPDLLAHALCGSLRCERSIASTSQMLDPRTGSWSAPVLAAYGIPETLFAPLTDSGTVVGEYRDEFQGRERRAAVVAVAGHDTQCAVAAMPASEADAAFLSCGTWSLLGCELDAPLLGRESMEAELSNELGAGGSVDYLQNIIGLWLIQESRREWRRQGREYSYADLERLALEARPLRSFIDPDAPEFAPPGDIPQRVRDFCRRTGQPVPETVGQVMRCIYESLALKYRSALGRLERLTGRRFRILHVLGGGVKDRLLCQMTADCCGVPVAAGPAEATALGNILIQLMALGELSGLEEGRALIARTEPLKRYEPGEGTLWDNAFEAFQQYL